MNYLMILFEKDLVQAKNYFKEFKTNKKKLIPVIFYIVWFGFIIKSNLNNPTYSYENYRYWSLGILLFIFVLGIFNIYNERSSYFSMADVNFLFPSPISPKLILIYSIIKKSWKQMFAALFMFLIIAPSAISAGAKPHLIPIGILGYLLFILILEPLNFIINKYKMKHNSKSLLYLLIGIIFGSLCIPIIIEGNILLGLKSDLINYIPILGWARASFMAMFGNFNPKILIYIGLQFFLLILMNWIVLKSSDDYYEDVLVSTENLDKAKKQARKGKKPLNLNFMLKKEVDVKQENSGIHAIHWKNKTLKMKSDLHYLFGIQTLLLLIISIGMIIFKIFRNLEPSLYQMYLFGSGAILYITLIFKMRGGGEEDFELPYFFLIPENNLKKLIILRKLDIQRMLISSSIFFVLPLLLDFSNITKYVFMFINFNSVYILISYSDLLVKSIFRNETDYTLMLPLIKIFQLFTVIIPSIAGIIISAVLSVSFEIGVLITASLNLIIIFLILIFANEIVNRIELP